MEDPFNLYPLLISEANHGTKNHEKRKVQMKSLSGAMSKGIRIGKNMEGTVARKKKDDVAGNKGSVESIVRRIKRGRRFKSVI